jgi:SAM-dependent methyltransferase
MAEFDRISDGYSAGFDDPLKKVMGDSAGAFLAPKLNLLIEHGREAGFDLASGSGNLLDFGCGAGDFLGGLVEACPAWRLEGCDVSTGMLDEARKRLGARSDKVKLWEIAENRLPSEAYDVVTIVCVLHHIAPGIWASVLKNIAASLRPAGLLAIFEHNPWNPVTRWMVSRTEVDRNAILLSSSMLKRMILVEPFKSVTVDNFLFFPPRLTWLSRSEAVLRSIPMGGQYALFARRK